MRRDAWAGALSWWSCQSPVAHSCSLLNHPTFWVIQIVSTEECSSLTHNLMRIRCFTCSAILNAMATQYTCSLNAIYYPHWLVQWSHHCLHMYILAHSPWLPGYIDVIQTVLVTLIVAGHFLDRHHLIITLTNVAQLVGASSCKPRGHGFDSWSGHMPRLWVQSLVGACKRDNQSVFLMSMFLSLSPSSLPL